MACGLVGCLMFLVSCQPITPSGEVVSVARVVSGQTLDVLAMNGQSPLTEKVRLLGVQAPNWETQQPWNRKATEQLKALLGEERTIRLEFDVEPYRDQADGTRLRQAYVWQGDRLLNEQLVEGGFVLAQSRSPNTKYEQRLAYAQEKARVLGVGIWDPENPMR